MKMLRAFLVAGVALALLGTAQAQTRVGVTQAIDNNPIGQPPVGPDRVLRVGTDIQANETVKTGSNDRAHLVFLDGTTVTIGPNAQLKIDKFVYDPSSEKGELAMTAGTGVFRVIGGRISKTSEIKVSTPSASLGIRGGIMAFNVGTDSTTAVKIFGNTMTVTANGVTQTVTVTGQGVATVSGSPPGTPSFTVGGNLLLALAILSNPTVNANVQNTIVAAINNSAGGPTLQNIIAAVITQTAIAVTAVLPAGFILANVINQNTTLVVPENSNQSASSSH